MTRKKIVAGNWKMNTQYQDGVALAQDICKSVSPVNTMVIFGVPATHLHVVSQIVNDQSNFHAAAQNCYPAEKGAYTGEISVGMIKSIGAEYVIIGHSERRTYFNESDDFLAKKIDFTLAAGLRPIYCCGEALEIREAETHVEFVANQLKSELFHLSAADFANVVIAYEPIWAIGTGVTASPAQAQEMHAELRQLIANQYNQDVADATTILYGGSVKPKNANELFACPDVDGGLVGGASLKAETFVPIIEAMEATF
jgi:triosephosphate isomerase